VRAVGEAGPGGREKGEDQIKDISMNTFEGGGKGSVYRWGDCQAVVGKKMRGGESKKGSQERGPN